MGLVGDHELAELEAGQGVELDEILQRPLRFVAEQVGLASD